MNREIKFRAWDRRKTEMIFENKLSCFFIKTIQMSTDERERFKIMQYTGLKDKNLNEIYEGDIVLIGKHYYKIQYEIGSFMLVRCSDKTDMYEQFENCWNDDVYPLSQLHWESNSEENCIYELEVVGNIHQNQNLLEQS